VRTHTTARLEFDRETYTPCTSEELPSLAVKAAMIAALSDLVAGRADELVASATVADVNPIAITASTAAGERERNVTL
jgi:hypothetical protein